MNILFPDDGNFLLGVLFKILAVNFRGAIYSGRINYEENDAMQSSRVSYISKTLSSLVIFISSMASGLILQILNSLSFSRARLKIVIRVPNPVLSIKITPFKLRINLS